MDFAVLPMKENWITAVVLSLEERKAKKFTKNNFRPLDQCMAVIEINRNEKDLEFYITNFLFPTELTLPYIVLGLWNQTVTRLPPTHL